MPTIPERAANVSLYSFESSQLASDTFQVVRFEGREGISQLFRFELHLVSEDPDVAFDKVVDKPATFTMVRGDEDVPVHGIVTDFAQHGRTGDYVTYRATLRPRLHRLSLSYGSRIFQEKKVEDILRTVLKEGGLSSSDFRFALQASYSSREYCVQYEETDLNFISRLMEFEGMYYFFEHADGQETLVITDQKSEHEKIPAPASLKYHEGAGGMIDEDEETVRQFVCEEQVVTGKVRLRDYDYRKPDTVSAESELNSDMPGTRYEYGEHFRETDRGDRLAKVRNEEIEAQRRVLRGESNSLAFQSGYLFTLENHYRKSLNADYLLTQITHRGSQRAGLDLDARHPQRDGEPEPEYRNDFTCIPATVQYRPPRETAKPEVPGILTAKIESAGGDYAYIDDQGRYRAKMHFDRLEGDRSDRSEGSRSLPIRMKQAYTGSDYGLHFPNHADTEMIVAFENGDIDRPVALGTSPNPSNESPSVSDNKTQNLIRTYAENEILLDDEDGATKIQLTTSNGHSTTMDDGKPKIDMVTSGEHKFVMDDDKKKIRLKTADDHVLSMEEGDSKRIFLFTNGENLFIMDDDEENILIGTKKGRAVKLDDKEKKAAIGTDGDRYLECDDSNNKITLQSDKSNNLEINDSSGTVTINAGSKIKLEVGESSITMKDNGDVAISGKNVTVEGSTKVKIDGSGSTAKYTSSEAKISSKNVKISADVKAKVKCGGSTAKYTPSGASISAPMIDLN